jgi:hypothetical protein
MLVMAVLSDQEANALTRRAGLRFQKGQIEA